MTHFLFSSDNSWTGFILRFTLGIVMFPHGMQKMLGTFGGYGFKSTMAYFTDTLHFPWILSCLIIVIEFVCPLTLFVGLAGKVSAFMLLIIMAGAIITTNYANGFFMNWFGNQSGEGYEYHLLVIGICLALIVTGSGKYSVDNWFNEFFQ